MIFRFSLMCPTKEDVSETELVEILENYFNHGAIWLLWRAFQTLRPLTQIMQASPS